MSRNIHAERVYFMKAGELVKIGTTKGSVAARAAQLQTGCPHKIEVLCVINGGHDRESRLHRQFAHLRVHGEWFFASIDLMACIDALRDSEAQAERLLKIEECNRLRSELDAEKEYTALVKEHHEALKELQSYQQAFKKLEAMQ